MLTTDDGNRNQPLSTNRAMAMDPTSSLPNMVHMARHLPILRIIRARLTVTLVKPTLPLAPKDNSSLASSTNMAALNREDTQDLMASTVPHLPKGNMVLLRGSTARHLLRGSTVLPRKGSTRVIIPPLLPPILRLGVLQDTMLLPQPVAPQLAVLLAFITGALHREGLTKPPLRLRSTSHLDRRAMVQRADRADRVDRVDRVVTDIRLSRLD